MWHPNWICEAWQWKQVITLQARHWSWVLSCVRTHEVWKEPHVNAVATGDTAGAYTIFAHHAALLNQKNYIETNIAT